MSSSAVIRQTAMDKMRVSRAVAKLPKAGLITREASPQDRRHAILGLTVSGRDIFAQIVPLIQDAETELIATLSEVERGNAAQRAAEDRGLSRRTGSEIDGETAGSVCLHNNLRPELMGHREKAALRGEWRAALMALAGVYASTHRYRDFIEGDLAIPKATTASGRQDFGGIVAGATGGI